VEFRESVARWEEGLDIAIRLDSPILASYAFGNLCWARGTQGDIDEAISLATRWANMARASGLELPEANASLALASWLTEREEFARAEALVLGAVAIYGKHQVWSSQLSALQDLGALYLTMREPGRARETLVSALETTRERGTRGESVGPLLLLAEVSLQEFKVEAALQYARDALSANLPDMAEGVIAASCDVVAQVAVRTGDYHTAATLLGASESIRDRIGFRPEEESAQQTRHLVTDLATPQLGPEAFDAAVAEGAALPIQDVAERTLTWQIPGIGARRQTPRAAAQAQLSARELDVLRLMSDGLGNTEIARRLDISSHTATAHVSNILLRLDVTSRTSAVAWAIRNGVA